MRAIEAILDVVVIIVLLASMLAFLPSAYHDLLKPQSWGFEQADDKAMRAFAGDTSAEGYITDAYSAAEILLTTRVADYPAFAKNDYRLPDGSIVRVDMAYKSAMDHYTDLARDALASGSSYVFAYDYENQIWRVTPR